MSSLLSWGPKSLTGLPIVHAALDTDDTQVVPPAVPPPTPVGCFDLMMPDATPADREEIPPSQPRKEEPTPETRNEEVRQVSFASTQNATTQNEVYR